MGHVVEGSLAREIWSYRSCGRGFFGRGGYIAMGHVVEGSLARGAGGMEL